MELREKNMNRGFKCCNLHRIDLKSRYQVKFIFLDSIKPVWINKKMESTQVLAMKENNPAQHLHLRKLRRIIFVAKQRRLRSRLRVSNRYSLLYVLSKINWWHIWTWGSQVLQPGVLPCFPLFYGFCSGPMEFLQCMYNNLVMRMAV